MAATTAADHPPADARLVLCVAVRSLVSPTRARQPPGTPGRTRATFQPTPQPRRHRKNPKEKASDTASGATWDLNPPAPVGSKAPSVPQTRSPEASAPAVKVGNDKPSSNASAILGTSGEGRQRALQRHDSMTRGADSWGD